MVSKENPDSEHDAIVIGAGIGGLTCAAALVKGGKKVLVCEQHSKPGGYVTSFERKGFTFDGGTQALRLELLDFSNPKGTWDFRQD
jgi:phytoene dehydrogenase-like protein